MRQISFILIDYLTEFVKISRAINRSIKGLLCLLSSNKKCLGHRCFYAFLKRYFPLRNIITFGPCVKIKCLKIKWKDATKDRFKIAKFSVLNVTNRGKHKLHVVLRFSGTHAVPARTVTEHYFYGRYTNLSSDYETRTVLEDRGECKKIFVA